MKVQLFSCYRDKKLDNLGVVMQYLVKAKEIDRACRYKK